jgi:phosphocarrier protein HPr
MLAAGKSAEIEVRTIGKDEDEAMTAIVALINNKFGEDE